MGVLRSPERAGDDLPLLNFDHHVQNALTASLRFPSPRWFAPSRLPKVVVRAYADVARWMRAREIEHSGIEQPRLQQSAEVVRVVARLNPVHFERLTDRHQTVGPHPLPGFEGHLFAVLPQLYPGPRHQERGGSEAPEDHDVAAKWA